MKRFRFIAMAAVVLTICAMFPGTALAEAYYRPYTNTIDLNVKNVPTFESGLGLDTSGDEWYVNSNATGTAAGTSWVNACLTIDACINLAAASNGDLINVAFTHTETYTAANGFDLDKAGLTLIFHRNGQNTANLIFGHANATVACGAANNTIYGGRFLAGITAVTAGIMVEAACDNLTLVDLVFPEPTTSTFEFVDGIDLAALADSVHIYGLEFFNADATGGSHAIEMGNGVNIDFRLVNARIFGEFAVAAVWSNDADEEVYIAGGDITNMTTGQFAVEFAGAATGSVTSVLLRTDTQSIALDPGSMTTGQDVYWDDEDTADSIAIPVFLATAGAGVIGPVDSATSDSVNGKLGTDAEFGDVSVYDRLLMAEQSATSSTAVMVNGDTIFTVAGGPIQVVSLVSVCITLNDATASTLQYSADPTVGGAITISAASATLGDFAAGGMAVLNMTALNTAVDLSVVAVGLGPVSTNPIIINEGIITVVIGVGSTTGTWKHYLRYKPSGPGVTVTGT